MKQQRPLIDTLVQTITPASSTADTFVHVCRIIPSDMFSSDDIPPVVRLFIKSGLVSEEPVAPLSSSLSEMLLCPTSAGSTVARCRP
ncbi:hypothetical protein AVEN_196765-1 [Araneus ventricosus]|uniref:Uncharacterized protein n=1 Tax=Araneus ventricosus TaxID=182803 RepID=A0A4Y2R5M3_ARAVE|nr:hypothetical protein AVEN_196765-1 [Araneus ventricosus]